MYSYTLVKRTRPNFKWRLVQCTTLFVLPLILWVLQRLEPLIISGNWKLQPPLELWKDPLVKEYQQLFKLFDFSVLPLPKRGPKRNTLTVYAKVFLIKVDQKLHYSSELRRFFFEHPQLIPLVGFYPVYNPRTGRRIGRGENRGIRTPLTTKAPNHRKSPPQTAAQANR